MTDRAMVSHSINEAEQWFFEHEARIKRSYTDDEIHYVVSFKKA
jgi:uncharacterized protein YjcR